MSADPAKVLAENMLRRARVRCVFASWAQHVAAKDAVLDGDHQEFLKVTPSSLNQIRDGAITSKPSCHKGSTKTVSRLLKKTQSGYDCVLQLTLRADAKTISQIG